METPTTNGAGKKPRVAWNKGKKGKGWSPAQLAKARATRAANKVAREKRTPNISDVIIYLRHAEISILEKLLSGRIKRMEKYQLLTMLALRELEG